MFFTILYIITRCPVYQGLGLVSLPSVAIEGNL
jgi:hypothetical protein